jgi:hypothetical protein
MTKNIEKQSSEQEMVKSNITHVLPIEHSISIEKSRLQTLTSDLEKVLLLDERSLLRVQTQAIIFDPYLLSTNLISNDDKLFHILEEYKNSLHLQQQSEKDLTQTLQRSSLLISTVWEKQKKHAVFQSKCVDGNNVSATFQHEVG